MKDQLGQRMKAQYEDRYRIKLTRRCPTIIRLDGKSFHTYTKGLEKPFDEGLMEDMASTAIFLCENIMGAKCAYVQSDEISLLLTDYDTINTEAWFDYNLQKMVSVSASLATSKFNQLRDIRCQVILEETRQLIFNEYQEDADILYSHLPADYTRLAQFDSRCFQIADHEEVVNYFIWRQQDATRNSIQMLAQSLYSQKELHGKNSSELQELCFQKGHNWNDLAVEKRRGTFIYKRVFIDEKEKYVRFITNTELMVALENAKNRNSKVRTSWSKEETPIFSQDREAIKRLLK